MSIQLHTHTHECRHIDKTKTGVRSSVEWTMAYMCGSASLAANICHFQDRIFQVYISVWRPSCNSVWKKQQRQLNCLYALTHSVQSYYLLFYCIQIQRSKFSFIPFESSIPISFSECASEYVRLLIEQWTIICLWLCIVSFVPSFSNFSFNSRVIVCSAIANLRLLVIHPKQERIQNVETSACAPWATRWAREIFVSFFFFFARNQKMKCARSDMKWSHRQLSK